MGEQPYQPQIVASLSVVDVPCFTRVMKPCVGMVGMLSMDIPDWKDRGIFVSLCYSNRFQHTHTPSQDISTKHYHAAAVTCQDAKEYVGTEAIAGSVFQPLGVRDGTLIGMTWKRSDF